MTRILADDVLRTKLNYLVETLEICDAEGHVLGVFHPAEADKEAYRNIQLPPHITEEEIERSLREGGGRTLAEIWKDLGRT